MQRREFYQYLNSIGIGELFGWIRVFEQFKRVFSVLGEVLQRMCSSRHLALFEMSKWIFPE